MHRSGDLRQTAAKWNLLEHPFYRAWSEGTLPIETLARYASEYSQFIRTIPQAWRALGETEIAANEVGHAELWDGFAGSLGATVRQPTVPEVKELCSTLERLAGSPEGALGALYAFEVQQPKVAQSKLDGLEYHYRSSWPGVSVAYFKAHLDDYTEPALLESRIDTVDAVGRDQVRGAVDEMGQALWAALDGILATRTTDSSTTSYTRPNSSAVTQ